MKKFFTSTTQRLGLLLLLVSGIAFLFAPRCPAQSPAQSTSQDPQAAPSTAAPAPQTDAEKKAAERKKRFEEQKRLLDGGGGGTAAAGAGAATRAPKTDSEFYMNPIYANMLPNETQEVHAWDMHNNDVSARVAWSLSDSGVVDMTVNHHAIITAKNGGTVSVIGQIDGKTIETIVTVYRGDKLPPGVSRTVSAPPPMRTGGRRNVQTVTVQP